MSQPNLTSQTTSSMNSSKQSRKAKNELTYLGPGDHIGDGDTYISHDVLAPEEADAAFYDLKASIRWQTMLHRTGSVPRLVAVQGHIDPVDGSYPIYRHPADESPALLPFHPTVLALKERCESIVGHPLNHALIQLYRTGEDNISEHSDKTLDIVRDSSIVNLSLGAMRTMTLRSKRSATLVADTKTNTNTQTSTIHQQPRTAQRIRLPHNSAFILGPTSNANWLHAVRADKRLDAEKSPAELAFDAERISLTFRHIGTFIDTTTTKDDLIWGQGATGKTRDTARPILTTGGEAESEGEKMIVAFGRENHLTEQEFVWEESYGGGFDVVNFTTRSDVG